MRYEAELRFVVRVELESEQPEEVNRALDEVRLHGPLYGREQEVVRSVLIAERSARILAVTAGRAE
jgi:hypothetical protein